MFSDQDTTSQPLRNFQNCFLSGSILEADDQKQPFADVLQSRCLKNFAKFTKKELCQSFFRPQACFFIKKEAPAQVFSCEFCEIFNKTFFHRTPAVAASTVVESQIFQENIS